jgi:hypothetical protein
MGGESTTPSRDDDLLLANRGQRGTPRRVAHRIGIPAGACGFAVFSEVIHRLGRERVDAMPGASCRFPLAFASGFQRPCRPSPRSAEMDGPALGSPQTSQPSPTRSRVMENRERG